MAIAFIIAGGLIVLILALSVLLSPKKLKLNGVHVLITGGSSGIGRCIGIQAAKQGANVSILARNPVILHEAETEIRSHLQNKSQKLHTIAVDLTKKHNILCDKIKQAEDSLGPIVVLVNCAGMSVAGNFEDIPMEDFKRLMDVNYFGTVSATKAVLPGMKQRKNGRIVMVSSQAGQVGIHGFGAYAPSKYALRGLAESLQMEVKPYNIRVTLSFPPDTDTPGYKEEMKTKPRETRLISETSGLFSADQVARKILRDMQFGRFQSYIGLDGYMLSNLTCGMSPVGTMMDGITQVLTMSIFRAVSFFYLWSFDRIVKRCHLEAEGNKKLQ